MKAKARDGYECYHCKQWVATGDSHDCWTTTEGALTNALPEDILEAWQRLRETAAEFGDQRVYASHKSIMFAKKACYFFVRPTPKRLEVIVFLGRKLRTPLVRRIEPVSRVKHAHVLHITHRDQVEAPITDWLKEAYDVSESLSVKPARKPARKAAARKKGAPQRKLRKR